MSYHPKFRGGFWKGRYSLIAAMIIVLTVGTMGAANKSTPSLDKLSEPEKPMEIIGKMRNGVLNLNDDSVKLHALLLMKTEKMHEDGSNAAFNEEVVFTFCVYAELQKSIIRLENSVYLVRLLPTISSDFFRGTYRFVKQRCFLNAMSIMESIELCNYNLTEVHDIGIKNITEKMLTTLSRQVEILEHFFKNLEGKD